MIILNGSIVTPTRFPDNTVQVWKFDTTLIQHTNDIRWDFEHDGELIQLAQLVDLIQVVHCVTRINLFMPYCPYGRQDKEVSNTTTFDHVRHIVRDGFESVYREG